MNKNALVLLFTMVLSTSPSAQEDRRAGPTQSGMPTVLITGSNRGIGLGFATRYAMDGWNVIATARSPDEAAGLHALADRFDTVRIEEADVLDDSELGALARKYADSPIDILINNAAFHGGAPVLGDAPAAAPQQAAFSVEQSVAAMVEVLEELDESYDGSHLDLMGNVIPW